MGEPVRGGAGGAPEVTLVTPCLAQEETGIKAASLPQPALLPGLTHAPALPSSSTTRSSPEWSHTGPMSMNLQLYGLNKPFLHKQPASSISLQ